MVGGNDVQGQQQCHRVRLVGSYWNRFTAWIDSVDAWLGGGGGRVGVLMSRVKGRTTTWFRVLFVRAISVEGECGDPSEG